MQLLARHTLIANGPIISARVAFISSLKCRKDAIYIDLLQSRKMISHQIDSSKFAENILRLGQKTNL